jgi:hypothetical protein
MYLISVRYLVGRSVRPLLSPSSDGKPEAATAVVVAPDDGHEDARNIVRQVINLRICCIWLVDSVESMMMHGLANPELV